MTTGLKSPDCDRELFPAREQSANCHRIELQKYGKEPVVREGGLPAAQAVEAYKSLRSRLMKVRESRGVSSIVVTSTAHAKGKTLTAFNLAYCCAQLADTPVLLVDADLRAQGLTALTGNQEQFRIAGCTGQRRTVCKRSGCNRCSELVPRGSGQRKRIAGRITFRPRLDPVMAWASEAFKLVLIDSPPIGIVADLNLIEAGCNGSLIVVRAHRTTQRALEEALGQIDSKKVLGVVWNEDNRSSERYSSYLNT